MFFFSLEKLWKEQLELRCMFSVLCIPLKARCPSLQSSVYTGVYLTYPFCCLPRRLEFTIGLARTVMQPYLIRHFHISYIHLVCPPKFYPSISRGKILIARRNKKTNVMQSFGGGGGGGPRWEMWKWQIAPPLFTDVQSVFYLISTHWRTLYQHMLAQQVIHLPWAIRQHFWVPRPCHFHYCHMLPSYKVSSLIDWLIDWLIEPEKFRQFYDSKDKYYHLWETEY